MANLSSVGCLDQVSKSAWPVGVMYVSNCAYVQLSFPL